MNTLRWGILSTGEMASNMAAAVSRVDDCRITAVASRDGARARAFGERWNIPYSFGSYEELITSDVVDIVYIATPHLFHGQQIRSTLDAGKHVLCEKPLTHNAAEAEACLKLARERKLFLMEGTWMRFIPAYRRALAWIREGRIGTPQVVQADFRIARPVDRGHRLFRRDLGGGALLDLGVYPLHLAFQVLGHPDGHLSHAFFGVTGIDELDVITLTYRRGAMAMLSCGFSGYKPREAYIAGSEGYIKIHDIFFRPTDLTIRRSNGNEETITIPYDHTGYVHEVRAVRDAIVSGRLETPELPPDDTIHILKIMDALRGEWRLSYPGEPV